MAAPTLRAGASVRYHLGDGVEREGMVLNPHKGLGYSILPLGGNRILVPTEYVRGVPPER